MFLFLYLHQLLDYIHCELMNFCRATIFVAHFYKSMPFSTAAQANIQACLAEILATV